MIRHCIPRSWRGLSRPSTTFLIIAKTWMPGTGPGMTNGKALVCREVHL